MSYYCIKWWTNERISRCTAWNKWISPGKAAECFQQAGRVEEYSTCYKANLEIGSNLERDSNLERGPNLERDQTLTDTLVLSRLCWPSYHLTQLITNARFVAQTIYISSGSPFLALLRGGEDLCKDVESRWPQNTEFSFSWTPSVGFFFRYQFPLVWSLIRSAY